MFRLKEMDHWVKRFFGPSPVTVIETRFYCLINFLPDDLGEDQKQQFFTAITSPINDKEGKATSSYLAQLFRYTFLMDPSLIGLHLIWSLKLVKYKLGQSILKKLLLYDDGPDFNNIVITQIAFAESDEYCKKWLSDFVHMIGHHVCTERRLSLNNISKFGLEHQFIVMQFF